MNRALVATLAVSLSALSADDLGLLGDFLNDEPLPPFCEKFGHCLVEAKTAARFLPVVNSISVPAPEMEVLEVAEEDAGSSVVAK